MWLLDQLEQGWRGPRYGSNATGSGSRLPLAVLRTQEARRKQMALYLCSCCSPNNNTLAVEDQAVGPNLKHMEAVTPGRGYDPGYHRNM